ncbi:MAG: class I SAM-dependent methyltransferase family protein [Candidatus Woesearchaeota archaeon]
MPGLKESLKWKLSSKELSVLPSSFDLVGDILIFADFPKELSKKKKLVGKALLKLYRQVKVVCVKTRKYSGVYRTPKLAIIAGEKRKETVYKENNCLMKLDVEKCYFSPRLGNERLRVARLVQPNETVLVMFSGVAPYLLVIAKNSKAKAVYGVEKNPVAHKYALENLKLNKLSNVILKRGDVKSIIPALGLRFDRVLMPLPKGAEDFLSVAIPCVKRNGVLHFYDFLAEPDFPLAADKIRSACRKLKRKCTILRTVKCGQFSPRIFRICVDSRIT